MKLFTILAGTVLLTTLFHEQIGLNLSNGAKFERGSTARYRAASPDSSDLRYRPATGIEEIKGIARTVAAQTGADIRGYIEFFDSISAPLSSTRITGPRAEIRINPRAAAEIPANSWAFVMGHEFAHQVSSPKRHGGLNPVEEMRADIAGAEYAVQAGFDVAAHIGWMLTLSNVDSPSHGSWHKRALRLAAHFGIEGEAFAYWNQVYYQALARR